MGSDWLKAAAGEAKDVILCAIGEPLRPTFNRSNFVQAARVTMQNIQKPAQKALLRKLAEAFARIAYRALSIARYRLTRHHKIIALGLQDHYRFGPYLMAVFAQKGYSFEIDETSAYKPNPRMMCRMGLGMVSAKNVFHHGKAKALIHDTVERVGENESLWTWEMHLDYDYYGPFFGVSQTHGGLSMPYFMHPSMYESGFYRSVARLRRRERPIRVFFAGTLAEEAYSHKFLWPYMNRHEVMSTVVEYFPQDIEYITPETDKRGFLEKPHRIVLALTGQTEDVVDKHLLTQWEMLKFASRSHFFINPPGWRIPHSHNVIEAMAVGSIPIINYGRLFDPPLEDMKTCIAFATRAELKEKIQMALQMPDLQIIEMQANVCRYYDENLAPDAFYRKWRKALANQRTVRVHNSTVAGRESYLNTLWGHDAEN